METAARQPRESLRQLGDALRQPWFAPCVAGLAACAVLFGEGTSISRWSITEAFSVSTSLDPVSGGWGILLAFALAVILHERMGRACRSRAWLVTAGALSGLAVLVLFAHSLAADAAGQAASAVPLVPRAAADVAGIVLGFSATLLLLSWADALVPLGAQVGALLLGCAFIAVVLFDLAVGALVKEAVAVLVAALAVFSPVALERVRPRIPSGTDAAEALGAASDRYRGVVPIWSVFAAVALFGAVAGIIQSGVAAAGATVGAAIAVENVGAIAGGPGTSWVATDVGTLLAGAVLILAHRLLAGNDLSFYRWSVLGIMALTAFLSAVIPAGGAQVVTVLMTVARMLTFAFAWSLFSTPARSASPVRLFALGWLAFLVPNVALTRLGRAVVADPAACLALDCALAAAIAALFAVEYAASIAQRERAQTPTGSFAEERSRHIAERVQDVASDHGLTEREAEVLALLMQGRTKAFIADALVISGETVRTHTQHIYAKLGVHSHDELVDKTLG